MNFQLFITGNGFHRSNSVSNQKGDIRSRLGSARRGRPVLRRGITRGVSKRGRGLVTRNRFTSVGLRSDQILKEQRQNNVIQSQTFTRSRKSLNANSQLTVSVANDFIKRRRNSMGSAGYLNRQSLAQLNNQLGGVRTRRGPGSVKSLGSNRSGRSNGSNRSRGRGRGRGVGRNFVNKQTLNPLLQRQIAAIQGKTYSTVADDGPGGVNCTPTPSTTKTTLHQRFAAM